METSALDWVIVGPQTPISKKTAPKVEWIREIVQAADNADIPVFLKDKNIDLFIRNFDVDDNDGYFLPSWAGTMAEDDQPVLRKEYPEIKKGIISITGQRRQGMSCIGVKDICDCKGSNEMNLITVASSLSRKIKASLYIN